MESSREAWKFYSCILLILGYVFVDSQEVAQPNMIAAKSSVHLQ